MRLGGTLVYVPFKKPCFGYANCGTLVNLLTSLSEAQDEIVQAISQLPTIIRLLFGVLSFDGTPDV